MKKFIVNESGKTCELIIFEKYEHTYPKNEFKRIGKLIDFREIDRNGFDIHSNVHSGFEPEKWVEDKFKNNINSRNRLELDFEKIKSLVINIYKKHNSLFLCNFMRIFIYPWETEPKKSDMDGVAAFSPFKNTIHIWINPKNSKWRKVVEETIFHEQSHAYLYNHNKIYLNWDKHSILHNWMISEGLAENYAESVTSGYVLKGKFKHKWFGFTKKECQDIFKNLGQKIKMKQTDENYREMNSIMFGSDKYKKLTGYAIGYWIVSDYMTKNNVDIKSAHHKSFNEILKGSGWLKSI